MLLATLVVMVATLVQIAITLLMRKKVDTMLWVTFGLIIVLGGATIWFHDPTFIKWKPSALDWAMALALWISQAFFGKNLLQALVGEQLELPRPVWQRLNFAWIAFFALMGVLNLYVAYTLLDLDLGHLQGLRPDRPDARLHGGAGLLHLALPEGRGAGARAVAGAARRPARTRPAMSVSASDDRGGAARRAGAGVARRSSTTAHRHAGHAGAREGRHFNVAICSARFEGLSRVARHRLVYDALQALMPRGIHAVAIDARAPALTLTERLRRAARLADSPTSTPVPPERHVP